MRYCRVVGYEFEGSVKRTNVVVKIEGMEEGLSHTNERVRVRSGASPINIDVRRASAKNRE